MLHTFSILVGRLQIFFGKMSVSGHCPFFNWLFVGFFVSFFYPAELYEFFGAETSYKAGDTEDGVRSLCQEDPLG